MDKVLVVSKTTKGGRAEALGLVPGDILLSYDGRRLASNSDLSVAMAQSKSKADSEVELLVARDNERLSLKVETGALGVSCVEEGSVAGQNEHSRPARVKSEYGVARAITSITVFIGFCVAGMGALLIFLMVVSSTNARFGDFSMLDALPAIAVIGGGLLLVMAGQVTKAAIDTADYSRELFLLLRKDR